VLPQPRKLPRTLCILHLEDNGVDRDLVRRCLTDAGIIAEFVPVANRAEYEAAMDRNDIDAILADFSMPGYDGFSALDMARRHHPEVPFFFVTGTIGEELAIDSVNRGATDYVFKHRLERLVPTLRRALREAEERNKRRAAEEALRASEAFLRSVVDNLPVVVYRKDTQGRLTFANKHYCDRRGMPLMELMGKTDFELSTPELAKKYWSDNLQVMETRQRFETIEPQMRVNGGESWIHIIKVPVLDEGGQVTGTQGMYWDVTEQIRAQDALRRSEERFREMAETIQDVFWITSSDARQYLYISPAYQSVWGQPTTGLQANSAGWMEAIVSEDRNRVIAAREALAQGADYRIEYRIRRPDGSARWIEDRGYPVRDAEGRIERAIGVATDVTDRKQLEEQFLQAQKMEAIGQLAGGIAHDFNNLLTVISGHASLLLDTSHFSPEKQESLRQIYTAGERAASLTRQLLVFSRKQQMHSEVLDLNDIVDSLSKLLRRLIGEHIELELALAAKAPLIEADPSMMEQVLMNLVVNARDAMSKGGSIRIATEAVTLTAGDIQPNSNARPGEFVRLLVADQGSGIPAEVLPHIFEPFFTTKEAGKGTGLGLATVFGIVKQHRGWVDLDTAVNVGTTFRIYLPATPNAANVARPERAEVGFNGGQETILLVEDEASVRDFAAAVLQKYGYRVLRANSGPEALETWKWHNARIALLVTDMVMPENMTGLELAKILRGERPTLQVICTSGYSSDAMTDFLSPSPGVSFLHKPYQPRTLAKAVRDALDRKAN